MSTLEQAARALAEDHISRAARMAATAAGDPATLATASAWMQAGESLLGITELDRDDDTTPAEKLSQSAEVTHQLAPVVAMLRRALAAAAGVDDSGPDAGDVTDLPETVFLSAADVAFAIERLRAALDAVDTETESDLLDDRRPSTAAVLTEHEHCDYNVRTRVEGDDVENATHNLVFSCGIIVPLATDALEGLADGKRKHLAAAIDASKGPDA